MPNDNLDCPVCAKCGACACAECQVKEGCLTYCRFCKKTLIPIRKRDFRERNKHA